MCLATMYMVQTKTKCFLLLAELVGFDAYFLRSKFVESSPTVLALMAAVHSINVPWTTYM